MYYQESENIANEFPRFRGTISKIDEFLKMKSASEYLNPKDIAGIIGEETVAVLSVFELLLKKGLLEIITLVECNNCAQLIDLNDFKKANEEKEDLFCSSCQNKVDKTKIKYVMRFRFVIKLTEINKT